MATESDRRRLEKTVNIHVDINLDLKNNKGEDGKKLIEMEP